MKQVARKGIKQIVVEEVPEPTPSAHQVLIGPRCSLISSGTETADIHSEGALRQVADNPSHIQTVLNVAKNMGLKRTVEEVRAKLGSDLAALGYSGAGVIVDKHPTVTDLAIGQRVAYGGEGTGHAESIVTGRLLTARLPDEVPFDQACFATLGSIALNSVRTAQIGLGDRVAVIGLGLVGQLVAQLARLQGAEVIAADLLPERVELAKKLGAAHGLTTADPQTVGAVTEGRGADCVIVAAAAKTSSAPCRTALEICRDRGRIVVVGAVEMSFPWESMYLKEIELRMSRAYGPGSYDPEYERQGRDYPFPYVRWTENRNMEEFLRLLALGQIQVEPLVSHRYPLAQAEQAYATIMDARTESLAVVLDYPALSDSAVAQAPVDRRPARRTAIAPRPPQSGKIGSALVGAGNLAKWEHLPLLRELTDLRAVHSSSGVRGKSYGSRFGAAYATTEYQQILEDPDVRLVLIASRNQHHAPQALEAIRAGKHVFVEKPLALTADECRELSEAAADSPSLLTVGFNRRFSPYYVPMREKLVRRSIPAVVQCRINSPGISGDYWMADPAIGGAILGEACHFVDLMYWLLDAEPLSVTAYSLPTELKEPVGQNNLVASFRFADGSVGNLTYCTIGSATSGGERVEAYADNLGIVSEDFKRLSINLARASTRSSFWAKKGYREQMQSFLEAIDGGREPEVTLQDGVRATIGCLRMLESAKTGQPLSLEW